MEAHPSQDSNCEIITTAASSGQALMVIVLGYPDRSMEPGCSQGYIKRYEALRVFCP